MTEYKIMESNTTAEAFTKMAESKVGTIMELPTDERVKIHSIVSIDNLEGVFTAKVLGSPE